MIPEAEVAEQLAYNLYVARDNLAGLKAKREEAGHALDEWVEKNYPGWTELQAMNDIIDSIQTEVSRLEDQVRTQVLQCYMMTGQKTWRVGQVRTLEKIVVEDEEAAVRWARKLDPALVQIKYTFTAAFNKMVKALPTLPTWARVETTYPVAIPSDLSFLEEREG